MHVEDPNPLTGRFLIEEISPHNLYLSNRTIKGDNYTCGGNTIKEKYYADFEARNNVLAGNQSIYWHEPDPNTPMPVLRSPRIRTAQGDFVVDDGAVVTLRANNSTGNCSVTLGAGFSAKAGSIFRAYIFNDPNMCAPLSAARMVNNNVVDQENNFNRPIISTQMINRKSIDEKKLLTEEIKLYPNPTNGDLYFETEIFTNFNYKLTDIGGRVLEEGILTPKLNVGRYNMGVYLIIIKSDKIEQTNRIILY